MGQKTRRTRKVLRLRQLRRGRELTQAQLAKRLGLPRKTINMIEKARQQPSLDQARDIADFFGESIERTFEYVEISS